MEPLTLLRQCMWDLHRLGCAVPGDAARRAEQEVRRAQQAGAEPRAALARGPAVLRREAAASTAAR
jgi:hypothetical protein